MPVITADVDLLDAQIITLDRTPTELDARRIRRARRRVLAARRRAAQPHGRHDPAGRCGVSTNEELTLDGLAVPLRALRLLAADFGHLPAPDVRVSPSIRSGWS